MRKTFILKDRNLWFYILEKNFTEVWLTASYSWISLEKKPSRTPLCLNQDLPFLSLFWYNDMPIIFMFIYQTLYFCLLCLNYSRQLFAVRLAFRMVLVNTWTHKINFKRPLLVQSSTLNISDRLTHRCISEGCWIFNLMDTGKISLNQTREIKPSIR